MGRVYLAFSPGGRAVAVKVIHPELARDPIFLARFGQEVAAARQVSGAYTAPVVDTSDQNEDPPWMATVFVPGPSLAEAVSDLGTLPPESLWPLAAGLAEALAVVHSRGLVHRDLKPLNVLLAADGPRVIDFGISRALDAATATTTGTIVGTPSFMSPEQAEGFPVGPASDVFSLGCVLAYAATGTGPFGAGTPASIIYRIVHTQPSLEGISGPLRDLITRCLQKAPAERPTPAELMDFIRAQAAPGSPALSFWPPDLADAIAAYQAQLASATPLAAWPKDDGAATPPPHEPTQVAATQQDGQVGEQTVTGLHPGQAASAEPSLPAGGTSGLIGGSSRRRLRRAAIVAAATILAIAAVIVVSVAVGAKRPKPVPTPTPAAAARTPLVTVTTPALAGTVMAVDGVYVVGTDIQPGTYSTSGVRSTAAGNKCHYALLSSTKTDDVIDDNSVTGPATITVGGRVKAVEVSDCSSWHKTPATVRPTTASPAANGTAVTFGCKILQTGPGQEEFDLSTTGGTTYSGTVSVTFYDYAGSGDTFPPTSVQGATPVGSLHPVPAADIGASAEPLGCIARAG